VVAGQQKRGVRQLPVGLSVSRCAAMRARQNKIKNDEIPVGTFIVMSSQKFLFVDDRLKYSSRIILP
jgi:hypothetical protein